MELVFRQGTCQNHKCMTSQTLHDCDACVDAILARLGKQIVLGTPLGIGKPNALLNALYLRAKTDPSIKLDIITALSLNPPRGKSALEERFLAPIRARVWKGYPRLAYLDDRDGDALPDNVRVLEFYFRSGSELGNRAAQRDYISSNYTHVARDMLGRGVNLLLQAVAQRDEGGRARYSLSSNPDITLQLLPLLKASGRPYLCVAQVNRALPWLGNAAEVSEQDLDFVLDDEDLDHPPFAVPHEAVDSTAWAIGLRASALVRDGGTLQVGIGAMGDALCHALLLRERDNGAYQVALDAVGRDVLAANLGGDAPFMTGLYVASELISNALFSLFEAGIVRRAVYEDVAQQQLAIEQPEEAARLYPGTVLQGAFFLGPADFYRRLDALPEARRALIDMTSVAEVNRIYTDYKLEQKQRCHARFINMTMKATLLGAAVSDQLQDGQVVSGVGGQSDFVNMAHQLPDGRSVLLLRATFERKGQVASNLVWEYPHATIPRHMRDLFVTEYGVADLRGKTDSECVEAMLCICDSRFQPALQEQAVRAKKLSPSYRIPDAQRANVPERIQTALGPLQETATLPRFPFGNDLTDAELALASRLKKLEAAAQTWRGRAALARALLAPTRDARQEVQAALEHLRLANPDSASEHVLARLVRASYAL